MRLIACTACHAQYDVSGVVAESVVCRCGASIENRELTPVDAQILRCGACGAQIDGQQEACSYCGSEIVREGELSLVCPECFARNEDASRFCTACGVAFRPEALWVEGHELPCPACDTLMPPRQVAGVGLNECPRCNGLWVAGENFDRLVAHATRTRERAGAGAEAPRVVGGNPAQRSVAYRKCPECQSFMQRRNYKRSSGVVLDVCRAHGSWLDADELEQIAGFILSGGRTSAVLDAEHDNAQKQAAAAARAARLHHRYGAQRATIDSEAAADLVAMGGGLLRLLTRLLS